MTWIVTSTGDHFDYLDPRPESITIEDIAESLAKQCRFCGKLTSFYSIAQHSVMVSRVVPAWLGMEGLLHDAAEAYVCDLPTPLKRMLPGYRHIESNIQRVIESKFKLSCIGRHAVKAADLVMLVTEFRDLHHFDKTGELWSMPDGIKPLDEILVPWNWRQSKREFMERYQDLLIARKKP